MSINQYNNRLKQIAKFIDENDHFILSGHINADGDAIASAVAFHLLLNKLGKNSLMLFDDSHLDQRFKYLANYEDIRYCAPDLELNDVFPDGKAQCAVVLDVPGYKRLGNVQKWIPEKSKIIKIDHHPPEDEIGDTQLVDENASSTTALVYEVIDHMGIEVDFDIAQAIFTGIVYDTGRFSFSNTTHRDFEICSLMVQKGVKPFYITKRIFFENSFNALKSIGSGLSSLERYLDGAVHVIYLGFEQMKSINYGEIEELANYSAAIRGGDIGLFIREIEPQLHKVSFRSRSSADVNLIAKKFNGGGHARAAGCSIKGKKEEIIHNIIKEISFQLKN
jgi:phosphoesterase RecJ-like protein